MSGWPQNVYQWMWWAYFFWGSFGGWVIIFILAHEITKNWEFRHRFIAPWRSFKHYARNGLTRWIR